MLAGAPACGKGTIVAEMEVLTRDSKKSFFNQDPTLFPPENGKKIKKKY